VDEEEIKESKISTKFDSNREKLMHKLELLDIENSYPYKNINDHIITKKLKKLIWHQNLDYSRMFEIILPISIGFGAFSGFFGFITLFGYKHYLKNNSMLNKQASTYIIDNFKDLDVENN
jgi:hypothetical protein